MILSSAVNRKANISTASDRVLIRSCTSGVAAASGRRSSGSGGSLTSPAADQEGHQLVGQLVGGSSRMCAALIASHFLASNRAGLAFTRRMSKASTISSMVKTSRSSAIAQPSRAR